VAEVLGIDTDLVMGSLEAHGRVFVVYTPDREKAATGELILRVTMTRGDDGVLREEGPPVRDTELESKMQRLMKEAQAD
jgi:hypothetical protein